MGAFAPVNLNPDLYGEIDTRIVLPVLAELRRRDIPFCGVLYVGLMLTEAGPMVLEFNTRFGDPETQVVLPLLRTDFLEMCYSTATGHLGDFLQGVHEVEDVMPADWPGAGVSSWLRKAVVVVGASDGYPGKYIKGRPIDLADNGNDDRWTIHAGTKVDDNGVLVTNGGRVLGAVGTGMNLDLAKEAAFALLDSTHFEGLIYRRDIGASGEK